MDNKSLQVELKKQKRKSNLITILLFCLVTTFLGFLVGLRVGTPATEYNYVNKVMNILENEWYSEIYYDSYEDAPIAQFISSVANLDSQKQLDPYTYLIKRTKSTPPAKEYGKMGVNMRLCFNANFRLVKTVFPNSPAEKAGIKEYDLVYGVKLEDGTSIYEDYESYFQQEVGHSLILHVLRINQDTNQFEPLEINIVFQKYTYPSAYTKPCNLEDTLYVKIDEFVSDITGSNTVDELETILKNNTNKKYLIIDLINNGGGSIDSLVQICDLFLPAKKLISTIEVKDKSKSTYKTSNRKHYDFDHIFLYMNENTASASEMFIGCMDYYWDNLTIIGTNTFGKGIAQRVINLTPDYDFQYTFAKWYTPDNKWIHWTGFAPTSEKDKVEASLYYKTFSNTSLDLKINLKYEQVDTKNTLAIQKLCNVLYDANLREDGYFDKEMEDFVKQMQAQNQLEETGVIDFNFVLMLAQSYANEIYQYDCLYLNRTQNIITEGA